MPIAHKRERVYDAYNSQRGERPHDAHGSQTKERPNTILSS